jgi:hypothetical protein
MRRILNTGHAKSGPRAHRPFACLPMLFELGRLLPFVLPFLVGVPGIELAADPAGAGRAALRRLSVFIRNRLLHVVHTATGWQKTVCAHVSASSRHEGGGAHWRGRRSIRRRRRRRAGGRSSSRGGRPRAASARRARCAATAAGGSSSAHRISCSCEGGRGSVRGGTARAQTARAGARVRHP